MIVADLQQFLRNLGVTLAGAGAKKPAEDLERIAVGLAPFQALGLAQFSDFFVVAETYQRTGDVATTGKGRAKKPVAPPADSAEKVRDAVQRVRAVYEQATDPTLQYTAIEAEIKALDKLKKDEAIQVAREFGIQLSLTTKKAALEAIKRRITERKESFERTQFGDVKAT